MDIRHRVVVVACVATLVACGSTEPSVPSLVGTWNMWGVSDSGIVGVATGTMTFAATGAWSALGTIRYPGEPLDSIVGSGTWVQAGLVLTLSSPGQLPGTWDLSFSGDWAVLKARPPVFTELTLARVP